MAHHDHALQTTQQPRMGFCQVACFLDDCEFQDYINETGYWGKQGELLKVRNEPQAKGFADVAQADPDVRKGSIEVGSTFGTLTVESLNTVGLRDVRFGAYDARSLNNPQLIALARLVGRSFRTTTMQALSISRSHQNMSCVRPIRARTPSSTRSTHFTDWGSA